MQKTTVTNLEQLGTDLLKVYGELRDGSMEIKTAEALANVAGKVIGATKVIADVRSYQGALGEMPLVDDSKGLKAAS
jgi:hypothetical protein